jgi:hypothetical protein
MLEEVRVLLKSKPMELDSLFMPLHPECTCITYVHVSIALLLALAACQGRLPGILSHTTVPCPHMM